MSPEGPLGRGFMALHLTLALSLLYGGVGTAWAYFGAGHSGLHLGLLGAIEAVGAALFLWPRTLVWGGRVLLLCLTLAFVVHAVRRQFRPDLVVFAAATWLIMLYSSARRETAAGPV